MRLWSYYRQLVKAFGKSVTTLHIVSGKKLLSWTPEFHQAFNFLMKCLTTAPVLTYLKHTDVSLNSIGALLSQIQEDQKVVMGYFSKSLNIQGHTKITVLQGQSSLLFLYGRILL